MRTEPEKNQLANQQTEKERPEKEPREKELRDQERLTSRRGFLSAGSAALAAAGLLSAKDLAAQEQETPNKAKTDRSASDPGPTNSAIDAANPDSNNPLTSDAGGVQTFKYPFSFAHKRLHEGGWSREVTVRELAVSKSLAGVDMRLTAGGVRELHWHTAAEWAFMLYGNARITCIDAEGKSFVADVKEGDLWYFPTGIPHSIQGLHPDGAEFLLVFDDGNFSEYETVLLSDWMAHTPRDVVAKNFGVSQRALEKMPTKELFIFQAEVPGPLAEDQRIAAGKLGASPIDFAFRTTQSAPSKRIKSGEVRIVDHVSKEVVGRFGRVGRQAGQFTALHNVAVDHGGNIYTAEVQGQRVQRFRNMGGL